MVSLNSLNTNNMLQLGEALRKKISSITNNYYTGHVYSSEISRMREIAIQRGWFRLNRTTSKGYLMYATFLTLLNTNSLYGSPKIKFNVVYSVDALEDLHILEFNVKTLSYDLGYRGKSYLAFMDDTLRRKNF